MTPEKLREIIENHKKWLQNEEGAERANLVGADLVGANLERANLKWANLDFSCLPLWCGSLSALFDNRQIIQILYHAVKAGINSPNVSEELKDRLKMLADVANRFHRVEECGLIETEEQGAKNDY